MGLAAPASPKNHRLHRLTQIFWRICEISGFPHQSVRICANLWIVSIRCSRKPAGAEWMVPAGGRNKTPLPNGQGEGNTGARTRLSVPTPFREGVETGQGGRPGFPRPPRPRVTVAGQRRTFTGFAFQPAHPGVQAPWPNLGLIVSDFLGFALLFCLNICPSFAQNCAFLLTPEAEFAIVCVTDVQDMHICAQRAEIIRTQPR